MKNCNKCGETKDITDFPKHKGMKDGHLNTCKVCKKEYLKKYVNDNKKDLYSKQKKYYENNKDRVKLYQENNKDKIKETRNRYKERRNELRRYRWKNDINYRLKVECRKFVHRCMKNKNDTTFNLLGYTQDQLKQRIELNFKEGMSWDNYGEWHIDHIKPMCQFSENSSPSIINALCNLRPLWAHENMGRSNTNWKVS